MSLAMTMLCGHLTQSDFSLAAVNLILAMIWGAAIHGRTAPPAR